MAELIGPVSLSNNGLMSSTQFKRGIPFKQPGNTTYKVLSRSQYGSSVLEIVSRTSHDAVLHFFVSSNTNLRMLSYIGTANHIPSNAKDDDKIKVFYDSNFVYVKTTYNCDASISYVGGTPNEDVFFEKTDIDTSTLTELNIFS